jgi:nicotinate-nucleotide adenylyltransferase
LKSSTTPYETRLEMTRVAFAGIDARIEVSNLEAEIQSQYTWQVLEKLKSIYPKIAFVIGSDQLAKLEQWNRFPEVLDLCDWIVLERVGHEDHRTLPEHMVRVHTPAKAISSTQVREFLAMNRFEELKSVLPRSVREYMERNKTYGK